MFKIPLKLKSSNKADNQTICFPHFVPANKFDHYF